MKAERSIEHGTLPLQVWSVMAVLRNYIFHLIPSVLPLQVHLQNFDLLTFKSLGLDCLSMLNVHNVPAWWEVRVAWWQSPSKLKAPPRFTCGRHSSLMESRQKVRYTLSERHCTMSCQPDRPDFPSIYKISENKPLSPYRMSKAVWIKWAQE